MVSLIYIHLLIIVLVILLIKAIVVIKREYTWVLDSDDFEILGASSFYRCKKLVVSMWLVHPPRLNGVDKIMVRCWILANWLLAVECINHVFILLLLRVMLCLISRELCMELDRMPKTRRLILVGSQTDYFYPLHIRTLSNI